MKIEIELTEKEIKVLTEAHGEPGTWLQQIASREAVKLRRNQILTRSEHIGLEETEELIKAAYDKIPVIPEQSQVSCWGGKVDSV